MGRELPVPKYRCSECGSPKRYREDFVAGEGPRVLVCERHPEADILTWDVPHEAALLTIHREVAVAGRSLDDVRAEIALITDRRKAPLVTALVLYERWGGMPERMLPEQTDEQKRAGLTALYG